MSAPPSKASESALRISRRTVLKGAAVGTGALLIDRSGLARAQGSGFRTAVPSYVVPSLPDGVETTPLLTVGDRVGNGYRMVGFPDGLGAMANGQNFTLLMNHELAGSSGGVRRHGSAGAFVSKWTVDRETLLVRAGEDLTPSPSFVYRWDPAAKQYLQGTTVWERHCSADLPSESALRHGNLGTAERLFLNGEEITAGRAWARIATGPQAGQAWELPRLGKSSLENAVACPHGQVKTVVALTDDGALDTAPIAANNPSEVFIYVGTKQAVGNEIERAGLTNGRLYGVQVYRGDTLVTEESNEFGLGDSSIGYIPAGRFQLMELGQAGDVSAMSGLEMEQNAIDRNVFRLQRPEDVAWDPREGRSHNLYFVTTATIDKTSRLWRLTFNDIERPEDGGRIEILLTNAPGRMFDNIGIDTLGRLLLQEDTGSNPWVSKVWLYGIDSGSLTEIAHHDTAMFGPGGAQFITHDEESSGIIDAASILGAGWFLLTVQVGKADADPELVRGGQLVAMYVDPRIGR